MDDHRGDTVAARRRPQLQERPPPSGGTRQVVAAVVTPAGSSWDLHLAGDVSPRRVRTLAAAENALTAAAGGGGVDVLLFAQLAETCRRHIDAADIATAAATRTLEPPSTVGRQSIHSARRPVSGQARGGRQRPTAGRAAFGGAITATNEQG